MKLLEEIQAFLAARGDEGDPVAASLADGLVDLMTGRVKDDSIQMPVGSTISRSEGKVTIGMSHTINLGNYESTKPFLSASTEIGRGETMMVAAKRLWAEMAPVYAVILMREVKNGAVLSSQGAEAFAKLLLESVMGIEGS